MGRLKYLCDAPDSVENSKKGFLMLLTLSVCLTSFVYDKSILCLNGLGYLYQVL